MTRILVVDSHTLLRERIAELLRDSGHGWHVATVADVLGMRRLFSDTSDGSGYDLVVLDTNLPGADVLALARELRRQVSNTAVVLLTTADVTSLKGRYAPIAGAQLVGKHELATALVPAVQRALEWRESSGE